MCTWKCNSKRSVSPSILPAKRKTAGDLTLTQAEILVCIELPFHNSNMSKYKLINFFTYHQSVISKDCALKTLATWLKNTMNSCASSDPSSSNSAEVEQSCELKLTPPRSCTTLGLNPLRFLKLILTDHCNLKKKCKAAHLTLHH